MKMRFSSLFSSLILSFSFAIFSQNSTAFPSSYTPESLPLYADEALSKPIGELEAGVPVKLVQTTQNADQLELEMWRKTKGLGEFGITNLPNILPMQCLIKTSRKTLPILKCWRTKKIRSQV